MSEGLVADTARTAPQLPVTAVIPHRSPFLLIDGIEEGRPGESAHARYRVDPANPVLEGHFPGNPVFPGVLLIENMAQTACWVMASAATGEAAMYVLVRVIQCTFHAQVRPGDLLDTRVRLSRKLNQFSQFTCEISVAGTRVADAELLVASKAPQTAHIEAGTSVGN